MFFIKVHFLIKVFISYMYFYRRQSNPPLTKIIEDAILMTLLGIAKSI